MKNYAISLILTLLSHFLFAQKIGWVNFVGSNGNDRAFNITVDENGNSYTSGYVEGSFEFEKGNPNSMVITDLTDAYIVKYDKDGQFVWIKQLKSTGIGGINGLEVDDEGNVYSSGEFNKQVDFGLKEDKQSLSFVGNNDSYVLKLTKDGEVAWAKQFISGSPIRVNDLAVTNTGKVYTTGFFIGQTDFNPGLDKFLLRTKGGNRDAFVTKLDSNGDLLWAKQIGSVQTVLGTSIAIDQNEDVYVVGNFTGTLDFYGDNTLEDELSTRGSSDVFIAKYSKTGTFLWAKQLGGDLQDFTSSVVVDHEGSVIVYANIEGTAKLGDSVFSPLTRSLDKRAIVLKLDANGVLQWSYQVAGNMYESHGKPLSFDLENNIYVGGSFEGTVDFDVSERKHLLTSTGKEDVFVLKIFSNGNFAWVKNLGGGVASIDNHAHAIRVDKDDNVFAVGDFSGKVDFHLEESTVTKYSADDNGDIFIYKINQEALKLGVNNGNEKVNFSVFPNPTTDLLTVQNVDNVVALTVLDVSGRIISTVKNTKSIHVDAIKSGMYFLKIELENQSYVSSFVKK